MMSSMMMILGGCFVMSVQPMFLVSMLIVITLLYSLMIYKIIGDYWFSYILMMVMLSGVLVVFTYMASLNPNETFEMNSMMMTFIIMLMIMISMVSLFLNSDMSFVSMNLWLSIISMSNLFMVSFLLSVMLMVVWLSYIKEGAVRVS